MLLIDIDLRYICFIFFFLQLSFFSQAQYYVDYTQEYEEAYLDLIHLRFTEADQKIERIKDLDAFNLAYVHLENYSDFFKLFIHEDVSFFDQVEEGKDERIKLLDKLPDSDPYKKFIAAELNLQWALARSKFDELFKAGREVYAAYRLLQKNVKEHPDFIYNYKSLSIIHSLIETINVPGVFKNIFGVDGSLVDGMNEIQSVIEYGRASASIFTTEAEAIYMFMLLYQGNDQTAALSFLEKSGLAALKSPLATFVQVKLFQRTGQNDKALNLLLNTLEYTSVHDFPYLYFLTGVCHLRKLEEESVSYFEEYLQSFEGLHYIKETHQKLAWGSLIFNNNLPGYKYHLSQCLLEGNALIDDDQQAEREAKNFEIPNPVLLRARLLYDGGYYQMAYKELVQNSHLFYENKELQLEYYYRQGRITQALKNYPEAIQYYHQTFGVDPMLRSYMSCNASLQLGIIYESQNEFEKAKSHFERCILMQPNRYKNSLHQKAKTGLLRISKK